MVGIAVISHGGLCEGITDSLGMIAGQLEQSKVVSLKPGMTPEVFGGMLENAMEELEQGQGVLVLTDIVGGTPFNQIALLTQKYPHTAIVTGMNLPMLISAGLGRTEESTLEELAETAVEDGKEGIRLIQRKD